MEIKGLPLTVEEIGRAILDAKPGVYRLERQEGGVVFWPAGRIVLQEQASFDEFTQDPSGRFKHVTLKTEHGVTISLGSNSVLPREGAPRFRVTVEMLDEGSGG